MLLEIVEKYSLDILNFHRNCIGKWTRVQVVGDEEVKSVIDYVTTSRNLSTKLKNMLIDEEKALSPFRIIRGKGKEAKQRYSDHHAILVSFAVIFKKVREGQRNYDVSGWKLTNKGLELFETLTGSDETLYMKNTENYTDLQNALKWSMDKCFHKKKKVKPMAESKIENRKIKGILTLLPYLEKGRAEKTVVKQYIQYLKEVQLSLAQEMRTKGMQKTLVNLQDGNGEFSIDKFWKLRKTISTNADERSSIIDPKGIEIFSPQAITEEYRREFMNRLTHREINPLFMKYEVASHKLLELYLTVECLERDEPDFTFKEVSKILRSLKNGKASGPDGFLAEIFSNAGNNLIHGLTKVLNNIKNNIRTPEEWIQMSIKTLFKNKGSRKRLTYYRGIFLTCVLSKVLEKLINSRIEDYRSNINKMQSGSRKNRSTCDNIFVINSLIDHAVYLNSTLYMTSYDYSTCFDSLWLEDCLLSLHNLGVNNKLLPLVYELNKKSEIRVKTPYGLTTPFTSPCIVKQGTVLGPLLCCASTAEICDDDDKGGTSIGCATITSSLYVDDCNRFNTNINDAIDGHNEFMQFTMRKRL